MEGVQAERSADKWQRARRRLLWRQAVSEPLEPRLPPPGTRVGGLLLETRLGTGGFGTVYRARSPGGQAYAVKFIHLPRAAAWAWRELEVRLRLRRLGWVAVRGHGEWPEKAPRFIYLVMEYVRGRALHAWARRHNPTARRVAQLARALARQLAAVHRAGVVHRDVKCANVVVREPEGEPVLVDFGVGTFPGAHPVTGPWAPGTAPYRSPEAEAHRRQHVGERYEAHAGDDLWALGVLLYWLLTGTFPFQVAETGDSLADARALGEAILHQTPEPPRARNPRVPEALSAVGLRLLEKEPGARYPEARAVEAALEAALAGADATWDVPLCEAYGPDTVTTELDGELEDEQEEARWRRLEEYERLHPVRGEPSSEPEPPATLAPPTRDAPPIPNTDMQRARGTPWRQLAVMGLGLVLGLSLVLPHRSRPGAAPEVTPPVASALPTPGVRPATGQEVAPEGEPLEGDGGAAPRMASTPAPVAHATPLQDTRVKSPPKPPSPQPGSPPKQTRGPASPLSALAVTCALATGCHAATTPQVRPTSVPAAPCPEAAQKAMKELGLKSIRRTSIYFPGFDNPRQDVTVRSGPGATLVLKRDDWGKLPEGTVFFGELFVGRTRVYGRFTQAHTPQGSTYPVCLELYDAARDDKRGVLREPGGTADTANIAASPGFDPTYQFKPIDERE